MRNCQVKKFIKLLGVFEVHDEHLQFFTLILGDHIATERVEFDRDFFLGHRIAWITLGYIDSR